jgi:hypothetical protein
MARCDSYAAGNCTRGACELNPWIPENLHDGGDWAMNAALRGFQITSLPTVGSVVCYCRGDGYSPFGHVGSVIAVGTDGRFLVREENFIGLSQWDDRWSTQADVCGFILPPGAAPGQGAGVIAPGGAGLGYGMPNEIRQAWESVRYWTNTLGADLDQRARQVAMLGQLAGR